jgi:hypothetical protein
MTKSILFRIVNKLSFLLLKHDTQYKNGIPIEIWVSCAIYKLVHGDNFLVCSKLFTIGKSIMLLVLHEVVTIVNVLFRKLISWLVDAKIKVTMHDFKWFCCLPNIQSVINGIHIAILKTLIPYPKDYFYHKIRGYSIVTQTIVDCQKKFLMFMWVL